MKKAAQIETPSAETENKILPAIPKNFRQQADIEAFYRFVYENDLRHEALDIFKNVREQKNAAKAIKNRVKH
jgi:hypothetical protein